MSSGTQNIQIETAAVHTATGTSTPVSVATLGPNWTISSWPLVTPAGAGATAVIEESLDNYVADIRPIFIIDSKAGSAQQALHPADPAETSLNYDDAPTARIGASGCTLRSRVTHIDAGATLTITTQITG